MKGVRGLLLLVAAVGNCSRGTQGAADGAAPGGGGADAAAPASDVGGGGGMDGGDGATAADVIQRPLAEGLGIPCTQDSECPATAVCVNPSSALIQPDCQPGMFCTGLELTRAGLKWTGGYCATSCSAGGGECGASADYAGLCALHLDGSRLIFSPSVPFDRCVLQCGANDQCPNGLTCSGGFVCSDPAGAALKLCLPCGPAPRPDGGPPQDAAVGRDAPVIGGDPFSLDGFLWIASCDGASSGTECVINDDQGQCPSSGTGTPFATRGALRRVTHAVPGTAATPYTINLEVRGVAGARCYLGGTKQNANATADPEVGNDGWYVDGVPIDGNWSSLEVHVTPPVPGAARSANGDNVYYLNAVLASSGLCETHETFVFRYTASFPVLGGGTITLVLHDSNCRTDQNCGAPANQSTCASPRSVDLTGVAPQLSPGLFTQPYRQASGAYPQWLLFDVKSVTSP